MDREKVLVVCVILLVMLASVVGFAYGFQKGVQSGMERCSRIPTHTSIGTPQYLCNVTFIDGVQDIKCG